MRTKILNQTFVEWACFSCGDVDLVVIIFRSRGGKRVNKQTFVKSQCAALRICMYVYISHRDVVNLVFVVK